MHITRDGFLGKTFFADQPQKGYRANMDTILLPCALQPKDNASVIDLGCGTGISTLCGFYKFPHMAFSGIDCQPDLITMAHSNAVLNKAPLSFFCHTLGKQDPLDRYDIGMTNPPFYQKGKGTQGASSSKNASFFREMSVCEWIEACFSWIRPEGTLYVIYPLDQLPVIHNACASYAQAYLVIVLWQGRFFPRAIVALRRISYSVRVYTSLPLYSEKGQYSAYGKALFYGMQSLTWCQAENDFVDSFHHFLKNTSATPF